MRMAIVQEDVWNDLKKGSWKLPNTIKIFFVELEFYWTCGKSERHQRMFSVCYKEMILCGLAMDLNGIWNIEQLFTHFQEILRK